MSAFQTEKNKRKMRKRGIGLVNSESLTTWREQEHRGFARGGGGLTPKALRIKWCHPRDNG